MRSEEALKSKITLIYTDISVYTLPDSHTTVFLLLKVDTLHESCRICKVNLRKSSHRGVIYLFIIIADNDGRIRHQYTKTRNNRRI